MSRLIVLSNRVTMPDNNPMAGGLAVALQDILTGNSVIWMGWNGAIIDSSDAGEINSFMTDSTESPALAYADCALAVSVNSSLNIDSYTSVHALLTSIMRFIYVKDQEKVNGNWAKAEEVYKERNLFI